MRKERVDELQNNILSESFVLREKSTMIWHRFQSTMMWHSSTMSYRIAFHVVNDLFHGMSGIRPRWFGNT